MFIGIILHSLNKTPDIIKAIVLSSLTAHKWLIALRLLELLLLGSYSLILLAP